MSIIKFNNTNYAFHKILFNNRIELNFCIYYSFIIILFLFLYRNRIKIYYTTNDCDSDVRTQKFVGE
jgi:hypothetical protein